MNKIEYGTEFLDQLKDKVHEQQWEIERLNKENEKLDKVCARKSRYIDKKDLEIGRLNNIINSLEETLNKLIKEQLEQYNKRVENWEEKRNVNNTWLTSRDCYYSVLKYLQKLKGVDKE